MTRMRLLSFHSVKGGVGKSTLATLSALRIAALAPQQRVWLIDMDLTGTSLSDALPLVAPRLASESPMTTAPAGFLDVDETATAVESRDELQVHPGPPLGVAYLNDWLLFADPTWEAQREARLDVVSWKMLGAPENLRVLPSSALPKDLTWVLPVIFDEEHAAFLEGRLELLLAAISREAPNSVVVFDVPPTLPGLSRALLGLALRLGVPERPMLPLSTLDPWIPPELDRADLRWRAVLVCTPDHQDIRALQRWISQIKPADESVFQVLYNRAPQADSTQQDAALSAELDLLEMAHPLWEGRLALVENPLLRIFRGLQQTPPLELLDPLLEGLL